MIPLVLLGGGILWALQIRTRLTRFLHLLQLEGYNSPRFVRWLRQRPGQIMDKPELVVEILLLIAYLVLFLGTRATALGAYAVPTLWFLAGGYLLVYGKRRKPRKPLVYTARALRILAGTVALGALTALGCWAVLGGGAPAFLPAFVAAMLVSQMAAPLVLLAHLALLPLEWVINAGYERSARAKIARVRPRVIAITGSYGKTSTKFFLASILSRRFRVLMTPESYNTLMGITKVIRGDLTQEHQLFVVEMGAFRRGDIKDLCDLTPPEIGILTAVGPQHLERFLALENIARAKYELIEALPPGGIAVFNADDEVCSRLADRAEQELKGLRVVRYGCGARAELTASDISLGTEGLRFMVNAGSRGRALFETRLLGRHNVQNILAATAVALEMDMPLEEVGGGVRELEPPPHRLQILPGFGGVTVIDDAYSSNPAGARGALEVLALFKGGSRILVTPGMVELGPAEFEENKRLGILAAGVCDFVILVGRRRTLAILEGLREAGFPQERLTVVKDLDEARERLRDIVRSADVVLFENDLPDHYAEDW